MAIVVRPTGEAKAAAQAGRQIGSAEAANKQREQDARQLAHQWELQKMLLNSQQDFAHEQRMRQVQLDAIARSREWEVEKMVLRSQMDFQQEEKERQHKISSINSQLDQLDKAAKTGMYDANMIDNTRLELELELANAKAGNQARGIQIPSKNRNQLSFSQQDQQLNAIVGELGAGMNRTEKIAAAREIDPQATAIILGEQPTQLTGEKVLVTAPDGSIGYLDKSELSLPQYQGFTPTPFQGGQGGEFKGTGATGGWTPEPGFPFRKTGSIADWYREITKKRGSIADLLGI